ncbi:MAG: apolipoprotein N-acyltransferase, partial [Hyphomonadaceae bacterium]|nr:apolipoprotein N-acyltransferase [Hyphomonadaceae bacterium]
AGGPISQVAALINIYGLTAIVFAVSACLALVWTSGQKIVPALVAGVVPVLMAGFGFFRVSSSDITYHNDINFRLVQVQFKQSERFNPDRNDEIMTEFIRQSVSPGIEDITHLIWPEGAVRGLALENADLMRTMSDVLSRDDDTPPVWLLDTLRHEYARNASGEIQNVYYNSSVAITFTAEGVPAVAASNDKRRLVPFGEFIPGGGILEDLGARTIVPNLTSLTPAPEKTLVAFPGLPVVSARICYEIIFPGLMPDLGKAEWILNQSNDAWYGSSVGPHHHANIAAYRAIETGLPIVRSTSNGISGVIDPYGRYIRHMLPDSEGVLDTALPQAQKTGQPTRQITCLIALFCLIGVTVNALVRRAG